MIEVAGGMITVAWVFIACGVWAILMGAMLVHCMKEELNEREFYSLGNEQWQRDKDKLRNE